MNNKNYTQEEMAKVLDLLNDAYVFIAYGHKAHQPWRKALDAWQKRVEAETGWKAFEQIQKFNLDSSNKSI